MPWSTIWSDPGRPSRLPMAKQCTMRAVPWMPRVGFTGLIGVPVAVSSKNPPLGLKLRFP